MSLYRLIYSSYAPSLLENRLRCAKFNKAIHASTSSPLHVDPRGSMKATWGDPRLDNCATQIHSFVIVIGKSSVF